MFWDIQEGNFHTHAEFLLVRDLQCQGPLTTAIRNTFRAPSWSGAGTEPSQVSVMNDGLGWSRASGGDYPANGGRGRKDASERKPGLPSEKSTHSSVPRWTRNAPG